MKLTNLLIELITILSGVAEVFVLGRILVCWATETPVSTGVHVFFYILLALVIIGIFWLDAIDTMDKKGQTLILPTFLKKKEKTIKNNQLKND